MVALMTVGVVVALGVLCQSALAGDGLTQDPPTEQPAGPDGAPAGTPVLTDESGPVQVPARPTGQRLKMDGALGLVAETAATSGDAAALAVAESRGLTVVGGAVRVVVESVSMDLTNAEAAISAAGGTVEAAYADAIQALLPPSGLDQVAASPDVRMVRAPARFEPNSRPAPGRAR